MMNDTSKPKFSDIIGGLVSGVAQARAIADIEALRMANRYRQIDLLKTLPVPRLRLRRVSISIPMVVSEIIPGVPCTHVPQEELASKVGEAAAKAVAVIVDVMGKEAEERTSTLPAEQAKELFQIAKGVKDEFSEEFFVNSLRKRLEQRHLELNIVAGAAPVPDTLIRVTAGEVARDLFTDAVKLIARRIISGMFLPKENEKEKSRDIRKSEVEKKIESLFERRIVSWAVEKIRHEAEAAAVTKPTVPPDFYVLVDTETIKNAGGGPNAVTRINMVLLEEGLEWVTEVHDGSETTKLMQE